MRTHTYRQIARTGFNLGWAICLLISLSGLSAQNLALSDSLELVFTSGQYEQAERLNLLRELAVHHTDTDKKLLYSDSLIQTARAAQADDFLLDGLLEKGNALRLKGDLSQSLENYFEVARLAADAQSKGELGKIYIPIADVYSIMGNHSSSVNYYRLAIDILREENDSISLASALLNAGDEYFNHQKLDTALLLFRESGEIFDALDYKIGVAYNLGNVGLVYAQQGNHAPAEKNINEAINLLTSLGDYYPISVYLTYMSDIYFERGEVTRAISYARKSLELAEEQGLKKEIGDAHLQLSKLYEAVDAPERALTHYRAHIAYRDSISNLDLVQKTADLRTDFEVSKKQMEVDLLNQQKKTQRIVMFATIGFLITIVLLAGGLLHRYLFIRQTKAIIEDEKNRSDKLLLNILPAGTARELKQKGRVQAQRFESVTVLFTDFQEFSQYAENLPPEQLVQSIDYYFSQFDAIIEKYGLEKIKTVGDSYMCAAGLPLPMKDHATIMIRAAMEIATFVATTRRDPPPQVTTFDVRIGINTGPVVAGVVGTKKFAYDIWGDTVNIASRMESSSQPGQINISEHTFALVEDQFACTYRGEIKVKNRGKMKMYFVQQPHEVLVAAG